VDMVRGQVEVAALTCSADGSVLVTRDHTHRIAAAPVAAVVDSTGAGDLYAAGLLFGLARDLPLPACGRLGSLAAAEVLGHYGARPQRPLAPLVAAALQERA
jgi:sugar/nucleoside kinase (ribokinase family)